MANPFHIRGDRYECDRRALSNMRVDREEDLAVIHSAIAQRGHNVLLYGTRGVGKSFLLGLLEMELAQSSATIYPCRVNLASLRSYAHADNASAFSRAVLLQFCKTLWTDVLGKSYLDLRDRLNESRHEIHLRGKDETTIERVYGHLMLLDQAARNAEWTTAGFSVGVRGEKKEEISREAHHSQVLPFEFAEFSQELIENVLAAHGMNRLVVLCDEANLIPIFDQEEILSQCLEVFSSKRVQFVFVAGLAPWDDKVYLPSCFETRRELKGFQKKQYVEQLVRNVLDASDEPCLDFDPQCLDVVFESYHGHPRQTLDACCIAYDYSAEAGANMVTPQSIMRACREIDEYHISYTEAMRRERDGYRDADRQSQ